MRVRKQDANGDKVWGHGQADFWRDQPEAVAQLVQTRLGLWLGQWFLFSTDGTPYQTKILGKRTEATRDPLLQARILQTPGVQAIKQYSSALNRDTRAWSVRGLIDTIYGRVPFTTRVATDVSVFKGR